MTFYALLAYIFAYFIYNYLLSQQAAAQLKKTTEEERSAANVARNESMQAARASSSAAKDFIFSVKNKQYKLTIATQEKNRTVYRKMMGFVESDPVLVMGDCFVGADVTQIMLGITVDDLGEVEIHLGTVKNRNHKFERDGDSIITALDAIDLLTTGRRIFYKRYMEDLSEAEAAHFSTNLKSKLVSYPFLKARRSGRQKVPTVELPVAVAEPQRKPNKGKRKTGAAADTPTKPNNKKPKKDKSQLANANKRKTPSKSSPPAGQQGKKADTKPPPQPFEVTVQMVAPPPVAPVCNWNLPPVPQHVIPSEIPAEPAVSEAETYRRHLEVTSLAHGRLMDVALLVKDTAIQAMTTAKTPAHPALPVPPAAAVSCTIPLMECIKRLDRELLGAEACKGLSPSAVIDLAIESLCDEQAMNACNALPGVLTRANQCIIECKRLNYIL